MNSSFASLGNFLPSLALFFLAVNGLLIFIIKRRFNAGRLNVSQIELDSQISKLQKNYVYIGFGAAALFALSYLFRG